MMSSRMVDSPTGIVVLDVEQHRVRPVGPGHAVLSMALRSLRAIVRGEAAGSAPSSGGA